MGKDISPKQQNHQKGSLYKILWSFCDTFENIYFLFLLYNLYYIILDLDFFKGYFFVK